MILAEAARSVTASMSTTVAATMTVLVAMFVLGTTICLGTWVLSWSDHVKKELLVKVYFCTSDTCPKHGNATPREINAVGAKFDPRSNPLVDRIEFVSSAEALKRMKAKYPDLTTALVVNPLPNAYEIHPKKGEDLSQIRSELRPLPAGVEKFDDGGKTSKRVLKVGGAISIVFLVAVVLLLIASTLLIANTIRLSIFSRRREIEVMKLVGATNWFVRGPFMVEGLLCGVAGSILAIVLLIIGKTVLLPQVNVTHSNDAHAMPFELNALILLGVGLMLGVAGSGLTLRRFLRV